MNLYHIRRHVVCICGMCSFLGTSKEVTATVKCPKIVSDYHAWMGGVDVHDQLRLQRYSLQLAVKFAKFYKSLFLGLIDMAITNAYVTYREYNRIHGKPTSVRAAFMAKLSNQLLQLKTGDLDGDTLFSPPPQPPQKKRKTRDHVPVRSND